MIKKEDLLEAIAECQGERNPNANTCIKLASYYTILSNIDDEGKTPQVSHSYSSASSAVDVIGHVGDSEFLQRIEGKNAEEIFMIIDELMTTLSIVNPRLYNGVMRKI